MYCNPTTRPSNLLRLRRMVLQDLEDQTGVISGNRVLAVQGREPGVRVRSRRVQTHGAVRLLPQVVDGVRRPLHLRVAGALRVRVRLLGGGALRNRRMDGMSEKKERSVDTMLCSVRVSYCNSIASNCGRCVEP